MDQLDDDYTFFPCGLTCIRCAGQEQTRCYKCDTAYHHGLCKRWADRLDELEALAKKTGHPFGTDTVAS